MVYWKPGCEEGLCSGSCFQGIQLGLHGRIALGQLVAFLGRQEVGRLALDDGRGIPAGAGQHHQVEGVLVLLLDDLAGFRLRVGDVRIALERLRHLLHDARRPRSR